MPQPSLSSEANNEPKQPKPWLLKHYQEKRQRTVTLVKASIDQLIKEKQTATIEAICRKSIELDPEGRGVKKSAILENPEAHAYYRQHSASYRTAQARKRQGTSKSKPSVPTLQPLRIDPQRNMERARYRYLQMTKPEIVERLLTIEQAHAEGQQQLARLQVEWLALQQQQEEQQRQAKRARNTQGDAAKPPQ